MVLRLSYYVLVQGYLKALFLAARSHAKLHLVFLFRQYVYTHSCLCKVTSCVSKGSTCSITCKNSPEARYFTFLRLTLLSSLLFHLRTLKIFSYQWLPVWTSWLQKGCFFRGKYVPTVTYGLPNVNTSRNTFFRGILREIYERTNSPHLSPEKMDDATWAYSSTHAHRARLHIRRSLCAVRVAVSPLSLAACTSRYIALKQLSIDQFSFTSSSCASSILKVRENGSR